MTADELVGQYPRLWHMAEDGAWPSIRRHGLLSTSALLDLYGVTGAAREALERRRRPDGVALARDGLPGAVLRDQKPLSDAALARCLDDGLAPADWYGLLNGRVFFWTSRARLARLLAARAYRGRPQTVLTLDTSSLVAAHAADMRLSRINAGATIRASPRRGLSTFLAIAEVPFADWRARRPVRDAIVEVAVLGGVPDIARHVLAVHRVADGVEAELWRR